jgi:hypothetical protein
LRRRGHSKDFRPDLPQVVIGMAVTTGGLPVSLWVWPGNTTDASVPEQVKDDLAVKDILVGDGPSQERFVMVRNLRQATRDAYSRELVRSGSPAPAPASRGLEGRYSAFGARSAAPKATVNRSHQMTTVS